MLINIKFVEMKDFNDYDILYPELIIDILKYFHVSNSINKKNIVDFCTTHSPQGVQFLQPAIITKICDILCNNNIMSLIKGGTALGINNNYGYVGNLDALVTLKDEMSHYYNSVVYGFEYVYNFYKDKVIPIIAYTEDKKPMMGSCFKFLNGIVTAKHCLEDGAYVSIPGYSKEQLSKAKIYISDNDAIDIAYIDLSQKTEQVFIQDPYILDDILVMGYPMIPRFLNFLTVEKATVSSLANVRFTPSRGAITSIANEMFTQNITQLMLITARITGGNSGGPVINKYGSIVGVAISDTIAEGDSYDELGYGVAIPIKIINSIIAQKHEMPVRFEDFHE